MFVMAMRTLGVRISSISFDYIFKFPEFHLFTSSLGINYNTYSTYQKELVISFG